jgi:uncharacterized protein (TIGR03000 family)
MSRSCRPARGGLAVVAAALLSAGTAAAQAPTGPPIPPGTKPFEQERILKDWLRWQAEHRPAASGPRETRWYIPPGAPMDRTFTWYAPPEGYEVIYEGTPAAPQWLTVVGPDGVVRAYRLEGPVVMRPHHYALRDQPAGALPPPRKYTLRATPLPGPGPADDPNVAQIVAHLPEDAEIFFQDTPAVEKGAVRLFRSPPLVPGQDYHYRVRVTWVEDDHWVSQTAVVPVQAGQVQCLDLVPAKAAAAGKRDLEATVRESLAKLSPEDRKLAEAQKYCVVQHTNRLGVMGVPAKVLVNGQPVFLCCAGCTQAARGAPEQALAKTRELRARGTPAPDP